MPAIYGKLVIEQQVIPISGIEDLPASLVFRIDEVANPAKLTGFSSKRSVKLPSSKTLTDFFEQWEYATRINPDAPKFKEFYVEVNGLPVMRGSCQLSKVTTSGHVYRKKGLVHAINLYGNNADWFGLLRDKRIKDYDYGTDHLFNDANVITGTGAGDATTDEYGYLIAKWLPWINGTWVTYAEHTPFVFIAPMLTTWFNSIGYKLESDLFSHDFFNRLIIPLGWRKGDYSNRWKGLNTNLEVSTQTTQICPPSSFIVIQYEIEHLDVADNWASPAFNTYTAPYTGDYTASAWVLGYPTGSGPAASFMFIAWYINGGPVALTTNNVTVSANAGDTFQFLLLQGVGPGYTAIGGGALIEYSLPAPTWPPTTGIPIVLAELMSPEWLIGDMILGLTHALGLMWSTDTDSDIVYFEPRDKFYLNSKVGGPHTDTQDGYFLDHYIPWGETGEDLINITPLWDLNKQGEMESLNSQKRFRRLCWKEDNKDDTVKEMNEQKELRQWCGEYDLGDNRFREDVDEFENPFFAGTLMFFDQDINHDTSNKVPGVPMFWPVDYAENQTPTITDQDFDFEPRILYWAGIRGGDDGLMAVEPGPAPATPYPYPFAFFVNHGDIINFDPSLSFGDEPLSTPGTNVRGLLNVFHLHEFKRLSVGKLLTDYFTLDTLWIMGFTFRNKLFLDGAKWIVKKIDGFNPVVYDSTKMELLLDCVPETADADDIYSSDVPTFLGEVYPDGDCIVEVQLTEQTVSCDYTIAISAVVLSLQNDNTHFAVSYDLTVTDSCEADPPVQNLSYDCGDLTLVHLTGAGTPIVMGGYIQSIRISFYVDTVNPPWGDGAITSNDFVLNTVILGDVNVAADRDNFAQGVQNELEAQIFAYNIAGWGTGALNGTHYNFEVQWQFQTVWRFSMKFQCKHYPDGLWCGIDQLNRQFLYSASGGAPITGSYTRVPTGCIRKEYYDTGCATILMAALTVNSVGNIDQINSNFWELILTGPAFTIHTDAQVVDGETVDLAQTCNEKEVTASVGGCSGPVTYMWEIDPGSLGNFFPYPGSTNIIYLDDDAWYGGDVRVTIECDSGCMADDTITVGDP